MIIHGVVCPKCLDFIFSRSRHDFHYCTCGSTFIDGGQDINGYIRFGGEGNLETKEVELDVSLRELFEDWNYNLDKLGIIKNVK